MARKRIKGTKYNRVTKQQKYVFLKLCISEKQSIHQAAFHSGIHYSTAKTILFFHKKQYNNYNNYFINEPEQEDPSSTATRAIYQPIPIEIEAIEPSFPRIQIISHCFEDERGKKDSRKLSKQSTSDIKEEAEDSDIIKLEENSQQNHQKQKQLKLRQNNKRSHNEIKEQLGEYHLFERFDNKNERRCQN